MSSQIWDKMAFFWTCRKEKNMTCIYSANSSSVTCQKWSIQDYQELILILVSISFPRSVLPGKTKVAKFPVLTCNLCPFCLTVRLRTKSGRTWITFSLFTISYFQPPLDVRKRNRITNSILDIDNVHG